MVDSHFHVQLTAVLDVLMKTAVSDICALAESWLQSLHMALARSEQENEDLRQQLWSLKEQKQQPAEAEAEQETQTTKEEKEDTVSEVRYTDDSGSPVFAGTSTEVIPDPSASAHLWSSSSDEESKKRNCSLAESVTAVRAHSSWSHTSVSTKAETIDNYPSTGSVIGTVEQKLDATEENGPCFALSSELKTESEKSQPPPQSSEYSFAFGSPCETESEECVVLDEVCETESPQHRSEDEQQPNVSGFWSPDLEPNSTHLLRASQSNFTNSDSRMTLNLGKDFNLTKAAENVKHSKYSERFTDFRSCEKGGAFTCNVCGKNLSTKNSLASHYRLHTREKPFMCTLCGKRFAKKFNLDVHYNIHTGAKPYVCALCPKSFADPSAFRRHEWVHTRKSQQTACNSKYRFSCNTCGKSFLSKPSLSAHSQLHSTEKRQKVLF